MKRSTARLIWEYLVLTIAALIFAFAWEGFMIPNGMSAGGMMGLCTVVQYATGGAIPASTSYVVVNAALILAAVLLMGIGFLTTAIMALFANQIAARLGNIDAAPAIMAISPALLLVSATRTKTLPRSPA